MALATMKPAARERLLALTPGEVIKSYRGNDGCACGCNGQYAYPSEVTAFVDTGYIHDPKDISPRRIANALRDLKSRVDEVRWYQFSKEGCYELTWTTPAGTRRAVRVYTPAPCDCGKGDYCPQFGSEF